ncbi:MAG: hypothetical protein AAF560_02865 [Acidobacteriota bacterium]
MGLKERLDALREGSKQRIPQETLAEMHRATEELRDSGILDGVAKVGDTLPEFSLANTHGEPVSSAALLAQGPLVVSFYRGHW